MRTFIPVVLLLAFSSATPAHAQPVRAVSVYSRLDFAACRQTSAIEEGESATWVCPGLRGVRLFVAAGDGRYDLDAGADNGVWESATPFNEPGETVEWRLRGNRPHAIIYRLRLAHDEVGQGRTVLGVETISGPRTAGCLVAWIDGDVPNANAVARQMADRDHRRFRCGHDEPVRVRR